MQAAFIDNAEPAHTITIYRPRLRAGKPAGNAKASAVGLREHLAADLVVTQPNLELEPGEPLHAEDHVEAPRRGDHWPGKAWPHRTRRDVS